MKYSIYWLLPIRHIVGCGKFKKIISILSISGVSIGVGALIVVMSVENGLHRRFRETILENSPEILVTHFHNQPIANYKILKNRIEKITCVKKVNPFIYTKVIIKSDECQEGIILQGIDTGKVINNFEGDLSGIVLGKLLSSKLSAFLFDTVNVIGIAENNLPRNKKIQVSGIFDAGNYEYNLSFAYVPIKWLQEFLLFGERVNGLEVKLNDVYQAEKIAKIINKEIGYPYNATSWIELNTNFFTALKLEKTTWFILLLLITIVACFGISATLIMSVTQKTREIGVLRAIGANKNMVKKIFLIEGTIIGGIGTSIGVIIGVILSYLLSKYKFIDLPPTVLGFNTIPVDMNFLEIIFISFGVIFLSFLASLYPAVKSANLIPSDALRYE